MMEKIATVLEMGTAKIKTGKNEGKTYWKPKVELAEGGKSFTVNIFEPKLGEALEPSKTYRLDMEKDDKGYWQIRAILGETEKPAPAPERAEAPDARGVSIERQVALKAAIEMAALDTEKVAVTEVLQMASAFADWLRGMPSTAPEKPVAAPVKPRVAPDGAMKDAIEDLTIAQLEAGVKENFEVLNWGKAEAAERMTKNVPGVVGIAPTGLTKDQWRALYNWTWAERKQKEAR